MAREHKLLFLLLTTAPNLESHASLEAAVRCLGAKRPASLSQVICRRAWREMETPACQELLSPAQEPVDHLQAFRRTAAEEYGVRQRDFGLILRDSTQKESRETHLGTEQMERLQIHFQ
jgi:hypothetical protein